MGTGIRLVWEAALEPCGNERRGREGRQGEGVISAGVLEEETAHHAPKKKKSHSIHAGKVEELHTAGVNFQNQMEKTAQLLISLDFVSVTLVISHSGLFDPAPLHLPITNQQQRLKKKQPTNQQSISC